VIIDLKVEKEKHNNHNATHGTIDFKFCQYWVLLSHMAVKQMEWWMIWFGKVWNWSWRKAYFYLL